MARKKTMVGNKIDANYPKKVSTVKVSNLTVGSVIRTRRGFVHLVVLKNDLKRFVVFYYSQNRLSPMVETNTYDKDEEVELLLK